MNLNEKKEALDAKRAELEAILAQPDINAEVVEKAEALTQEIKSLSREVDALSKASEAIKEGQAAAAKILGFSKEPDSVADVKEDGSVDIFARMKPSKKAVINSTAYKEALARYLVRGFHALSDAERKDLQEGSDPLGGYFVPEMLAPEIIRKSPAPTELAGRVRVIRTNVDHYPAPRVNYTSDDKYTSPVRVTWVDEIPSANAHEAADPTIGLMRIPVYTAMLSYDVSRNLLEDAPAPTMEQVLTDMNEAATLMIEDMIVNGTGLGQPSGLLENPGGTHEPSSILSGAAGAINADSVKGLPWECPAQYRRNGVFVLNSKTAKTIALFKDTTNNYLWKRGLADLGLGSPTPVDTLDGFPVVYSEFMPDVAATAHPIAFGDLGGYYLILRTDFSIQMLGEIKADQNLVRFLGRLRVGGDVARPWMLKLLKSNNS